MIAKPDKVEEFKADNPVANKLFQFMEDDKFLESKP